MNVAELIQHLQAFEELHPELAAYFEDGSMPSIRHPLVYSVLHAPLFNVYVNKQLAIKKMLLTEAMKEKNWNTYVFLYERPWRATAFDKIKRRLDNETYWSLLAEVWIDSENIPQMRSVWNRLLASRRPGSEAMMLPDEQEALSVLPETIVVYQGHTDKRDDGWSWTVRRSVAEWFADRFANLENARPVVTQAVIARSDVLAFFTRRSEHEILINPKLITKEES
jgi:hypothetical protein